MELYSIYITSFIKDFLKLGVVKKTLILLTPLIALLTSMKTALFGLLFLILVDLVTGIIRNLNNRKITRNPFKKKFWAGIRSSKLRETWRKAYQYGIGILVTAALESMILGLINIPFMERKISITEVIVFMASVIEVKSIFENVKLGFILDIVKSYLPKPLQEILNRIDRWDSSSEKEVKKD
jgi:hypothetical protein